VEIIKLLYHEAELLILDEPTAVLTPQETENLFAVLRRLKKAGHSVIIITHRIAEVQSIADRVTVLRDGEKAACLNIAEASESRLSELMIGRQLDNVACAAGLERQSAEGTARLSLDNISLNGENKKILSNISLDIKPGEILGLAGVDGNGQKELAEVIVGIRRPDAGTVRLNGRDVTGLGVRRRKRLGIAYVPDDRHHDGLILDMDVEANPIDHTHDLAPFSRNQVLNSRVCQRTRPGKRSPDIRSKPLASTPRCAIFPAATSKK
jgi:ABC-type uncharacterized transport system ATPase subunit